MFRGTRLKRAVARTSKRSVATAGDIRPSRVGRDHLSPGRRRSKSSSSRRTDLCRGERFIKHQIREDLQARCRGTSQAKRRARNLVEPRDRPRKGTQPSLGDIWSQTPGALQERRLSDTVLTEDHGPFRGAAAIENTQVLFGTEAPHPGDEQFGEVGSAEASMCFALVDDTAHAKIVAVTAGSAREEARRCAGRGRAHTRGYPGATTASRRQ